MFLGKLRAINYQFNFLKFVYNQIMFARNKFNFIFYGSVLKEEKVSSFGATAAPRYY